MAQPFMQRFLVGGYPEVEPVDIDLECGSKLSEFIVHFARHIFSFFFTYTLEVC